MIVVHNPLDIWVPEQVKDANGNIDPLKGYPIKDPNGEVRCWSIGPGETLEFEDHVGKYLLEVYAFLQEVVTEDQVKEREEEAAKIREGKVYSQVKVVKAEGEVVGSVEKPAPGFTNETMQPHNAPEEKLANTSVLCPECQASFGKLKIMQNHYREKHIEAK